MGTFEAFLMVYCDQALRMETFSTRELSTVEDMMVKSERKLKERRVRHQLTSSVGDLILNAVISF